MSGRRRGLRIALASIALLPSLAAAAAAPRIPLCAGLQIVTAVNEANGDYESIKTVESVNASTVRIRYSAEQLVTDMLSPQFGKVRRTTVHRTMRREDLQSAALYQQRFFADMPEVVPETTAIGTSSAVLQALRQSGRAELGISNVIDGSVPADRDVRPNVYDYMVTAPLERVGSQPVSLPVLVNGVPVTLPALHARGEFAGEAAEFFFLDDPANPLTLKFRVGIDAVPPMGSEMLELCREITRSARELGEAFCGRTGGGDREVLQVVKITHRCAAAPQAPASAGPAGSLEQQLAEAGTAVIYDIHFSFNSDRIREESAPRLAEIAALMRKHPEWALAVSGHTDAIGGAAYNLDLSRRRAAAVKEALVKRHGVAPERLQTDGFGASAPRATNETLEGRARNRRVELVRR